MCTNINDKYPYKTLRTKKKKKEGGQFNLETFVYKQQIKTKYMCQQPHKDATFIYSVRLCCVLYY